VLMQAEQQLAVMEAEHGDADDEEGDAAAEQGDMELLLVGLKEEPSTDNERESMYKVRAPQVLLLMVLLVIMLLVLLT